MSTFDFAVVRPVFFNGGKPDKNGLEPILLEVVAGRMPNRAVVAGTIAEREGFIPNSGCYLVSIDELEANEYGRQFRFKNLDTLKGVELMKTCKEFGKAISVDVNAQVAEPEIILQNASPVAQPIVAEPVM